MYKIFFLACFISSFAYAQQNLSVTIDGNKNDFTGKQERKDTLPQNLDLKIKGDSNKGFLEQKSGDSTQAGDSVKKQEPDKFKDAVDKSNSIITLLISVAALIAAWRGILFLKKRKNKK